MNAKLKQLFALVEGLDDKGVDFREVREAQGLVKSLERELEATS